MMTANQIRAAFLDFFRSKGHAIVPSAPMVVKGDPTLMFTNAGMNQFKDMFLGNAPIASPRVADSQKCLRVSGKHNDLEEVGHDTYHHTMFEMLGNWSFGDYFKKEAIEWAWELLVDVLKLPKDRIYVTVFEGSKEDNVARDDEAFELWRRFLPAERIIDGNKKDNFWEMGDTGPCGPCSEIHVDVRSDDERRKVDGRTLVNQDNPHVIEIWNLVFMQFNRRANGSLEPLPKNHVDTGMGFERLCMVLQGKKSNYDTDVFQPLIQRIAELSGKKYGATEADDVAMRVIADHLRTIAFAIADGQLPSNVKAGYVIRRILRRAVRYGYTYLGFTEPFICRLVDTLVAEMGEQYPELRAQKELIIKVIREEEASFMRTLANGITLLDNVMSKAKGNEISGVDAFTLYDTFGFPIDLTELIAREKGFTVDLKGFERELEGQKSRSRNAAATETGDWVEVLPIEQSVFVGYDELVAEVRIARYRRVATKGREFFQVVFDRTPFYGNSGGQLGDVGYIEADGVRTTVEETLKENGLIVHIINELPASIESVYKAVVDVDKRNAAAANHTATHLLHEALREVLGEHVEQKGSMVGPEGLRFDFAHYQKVTPEQMRQVERIVNRRVRLNIPLEERRNCPIDEAREAGAMMLFGEKYGDRVRMVKYGSSVELCGGTHVKATGELGLVKVLSESAVAAGVRRIEAVSGAAAEGMVYALEDAMAEVKNMINSPVVAAGIRKLLEENDGLRRQAEEFRKDKIAEISERLIKEGNELIVRQLDLPAEMIKGIATVVRERVAGAVLVLGSVVEGKPSLTVALGAEAVARGLNAGEIVRAAAVEFDGGGGGQPAMAVAGGKNPEGIERAINKAVELVKQNF